LPNPFSLFLCFNGNSLVVIYISIWLFRGLLFSHSSPFVLALVAITGSFLNAVDGGAKIPSTLDGPFEPVTVPFDAALRGNAVDLPDSDPRVQRRVKGFEPEQISVSLSANYDSVWISWITGSSSLRFFFF
jgi:hypothetical protein